MTFLWKRISVRLGEWDLNSDIDCQNHICSDPVLDVPIKDVVLHEDYAANSVGHEHDIALILLRRSVLTTEWIRPICLPYKDHIRQKRYDGVPMDVAGWGYTSNLPNGEIHHIPLLQKIMEMEIKRTLFTGLH